MPKINLINDRGESLPLFGNPYFIFDSADGLTMADVALSSSVTGAIDGDRVNNMRTTPRGIVLYLRIRHDKEVEEVKRYLSRYIKPKSTVYLETAISGRYRRIGGIVYKIAMPRFSESVVYQVTLHCSQPYWEDVDDVIDEITNVIKLQYYPLDKGGYAMLEAGKPMSVYDFSRTRKVYNEGDVSVGANITILAIGAATNPIIYDNRGNYIGFNVSMIAGDVLEISTVRGSKTASLNGADCISRIMPGSFFIQLESGENEIAINADEDATDNMYFQISYKQRYV